MRFEHPSVKLKRIRAAQIRNFMFEFDERVIGAGNVTCAVRTCSSARNDLPEELRSFLALAQA
jgi:hypothetical protein